MTTPTGTGFEGLSAFATDVDGAIAAADRIAAATPRAPAPRTTQSATPSTPVHRDGGAIPAGLKKVGGWVIGIGILLAIKACIWGGVHAVSDSGTSSYTTTPTDQSSVDESQQVSALMGSSFSSLPRVASKIAEDAQALDDLSAQAAQQDAELAYVADVGTFGKTRLAIDRDGVEWRGRPTSLAAVRGVRWGAIKKSVNGLDRDGLPHRLDRRGGHDDGGIQERRDLRGFRAETLARCGLQAPKRNGRRARCWRRTDFRKDDRQERNRGPHTAQDVQQRTRGVRMG